MTTNVSASSALIVGAYPNPTNSILNINSSKHIAAITLVDALGRSVLQQTSDGELFVSINIEHLPRASYIVHITTTSGETAIQSILKQ